MVGSKVEFQAGYCNFMREGRKIMLPLQISFGPKTLKVEAHVPVSES